MKAKGVYTSYEHGGKTFSSYIAAMNMKDAQALLDERNIGEEIKTGIVDIKLLPEYYSLPDNEFLKSLPEILHQTLFLSFIKTSAKKATSSEVLGDTSLLHKIAHLQCKAYSPHATYAELLRDIKKEMRMLYATTPGVLSGHYITIVLEPGEVTKVENIVNGSDVTNSGPAAVTICDCADPDCGITDDDQPCGYEQTIDELHMARLDTLSNFVIITNNDNEKRAKVQVMLKTNEKP